MPLFAPGSTGSTITSQIPIPGLNVLANLGGSFGIPKGMSLAEFLNKRQNYMNSGGNIKDSKAWQDYLNAGINGVNMPLTTPTFAPSNNFPIRSTGGTTFPNDNNLGFPKLNIPDWLSVLLPKINVGGGNQNSDGMPDWLKYLIPSLAGLAGGLANREGTSTTKNTVTTSPTTNTFTNTRTPNYDPLGENLKFEIAERFKEAMRTDPDLKGYESNEISRINQQYAGLGDSRRSQLASRGITGPAADNALASIDNARFGQTTQLRNQIPLLSRQLKEDTLQKAAGFFGTLPYGMTDTGSSTSSGGTTTSEGITTQSGNILGGIAGGTLQGLLAMLAGMGALNR